MTTILAVVAGAIFYSLSTWWGVGLLACLGLLQILTKSAMSAQYRSAVERGAEPQVATQMISDRLALVNMILSIAIWALAVLALVLKLT